DGSGPDGPVTECGFDALAKTARVGLDTLFEINTGAGAFPMRRDPPKPPVSGFAYAELTATLAVEPSFPDEAGTYRTTFADWSSDGDSHNRLSLAINGVQQDLLAKGPVGNPTLVLRVGDTITVHMMLFSEGGGADYAPNQSPIPPTGSNGDVRVEFSEPDPLLQNIGVTKVQWADTSTK